MLLHTGNYICMLIGLNCMDHMLIHKHIKHFVVGLCSIQAKTQSGPLVHLHVCMPFTYGVLNGHLPWPTQKASKPASWKYLFALLLSYFLQSLACIMSGVNSTIDLPLSLPMYINQLQNSLIEQSVNSSLVYFHTLSMLHIVLVDYWIPVNHYSQAASITKSIDWHASLLYYLLKLKTHLFSINYHRE